MGAEESILRNYEVGSPYEVENIAHKASKVAIKSAGENEGSGPKFEFRVCPAFHKEDGSSISVLIFDKKKGCKSQHGINNAEVLRTVRHPFILKYIGLCESDRSIKLLTEDVFSIEYCIHDLEDFEIIAGLHNTLEALIFMHEKGGLVHKNVCLSSVFVSKKDGSWKLGGMEKVEKVSSKGMDQDVNDYTDFAISLMDSVETCDYEQKKFVQRLQELSMKNKHAEAGTSCLDTGHLKSLLDEPIFKNSFLEISKFFNEITMKKESEKEAFFRTLADKLRNLDHTVVAKKLLRRLFSRITLAEPSAEKYFIPELLAFGKGHGIEDFRPIFPDDIYRKYCVPLILNLLFCNETHVRLLLLKHIPLFVNAIDKETLQDEVLPEILLGVRDENDEIVSATLHGLACLVKILGGDIVIGGERSKLFKDHRPKFASGRPSDFNTLMPVSKSGTSSPEPRHQTRESMQKRKEERKRQNELRKQLRETERLKKIEAVDVKHSSNNTGEVSLQEESNTVPIDESAAMESEKVDAEKSPKTEESDPDWEGFEAFSSESEAEEETDSKLTKSSRSAESLLMIAKDSLRMEQFDSKSVVESKPDIEQSTKTQSAETYQFQRIDSVNSVNSATSKDSISTHTSPVYKAEIKQSPTLTSRKTVPKPSMKLGEEFELQIAVNKSSEPDFFADMTPDLSKSSTVLIERNLPNVSSKFQVPEANSEVSSGWEEDDGWDDFT